MVDVEFIGGLGNNMFQYAAGRIIADKKGYNLNTTNLNQLDQFFKNVKNITDRKSLNDPVLQIGYETTVGPQTYIEQEVADFKGTIKVKGFFQRHELYNAHRDQLLKWFKTDVKLEKVPGENDLVLHVRLGDYMGLGWQLDTGIFIDILKKENYNKYFIVTDEPDNPIIDNILQTVDGGEVVSTDKISDFEFLCRSSLLVLSHSSFSWWASFLGNARKVIVPYNGNKGLWKVNPLKNDIDLIKDTSKYFRYVYDSRPT
tara:strand:+ start:14032 stop:14805 length:774 start_codon:yes stop_codon:yes gene_type:complete